MTDLILINVVELLGMHDYKDDVYSYLYLTNAKYHLDIQFYIHARKVLCRNFKVLKKM
jgi:hypothetical protein